VTGLGVGVTAAGWARPARRPASDVVVAGLIGLFPLWWVLGLAEFAWALVAVPALLSLAMRRDLVVPRGFALFALFLLWMGLSVVMIDTPSRLIGFTLRAGYYVGAAALALVAANGGDRLPTARIARLLTLLWFVSIAGGWLGLVLPGLTFTTPTARLLPEWLMANDFVRVMVTPGTAQVQDFLGFPVPRPKAPFTFTNDWGAMVGLLLPFVFAASRTPAMGFSRRAVRVGLALSVVPIVVSLNRGLWLSILATLAYAAVRFAAVGQVRALARMLLAGVVVVAALAVTPLGGLVASRVDNGHSDGDRSTL
jgi:hypothetical protein